MKYHIIDKNGDKILTNINVDSDTLYKYNDDLYSFIVYDLVEIGSKYNLYINKINYAYSNIDYTNHIRCINYIYNHFSNTLLSKDIILLLKSIITKTLYQVKYEDTINTISDIINVLQILDTNNYGISENAFSIFALYCHMKLIYKNKSEYIISNTIKNIKSQKIDLLDYNNIKYNNILRDLIYQDTYYGCLHVPYISKISNGLSKIFIPNPHIPVEHYDFIINTFYTELMNEEWEEKIDDDKWFIFKDRYNGYGTYYNGVFCKK